MNDTNSTTSDQVPPVPPKADGYMATIILVVTLIAVVVGGLYLWGNKKLLGFRESG